MHPTQIIRSLALVAAAGTALAAMPAFAQRASLADRVATLEQQAANNRGNVDLLNQVTQIKNELQAQRAQIEELQRTIEQMESSGRAQYLDLDGRLNRIEGSGGAPVLDPASVPSTAAPAASAPATAAGEAAPAVYGDAGAIARTADERTAYESAFDALKGGRYDESARLFQDFLQAHPNGAYAPNAYYWLGESYYVTQNYAMAQQQFQALLDRYPTHDKASGALLKVGLSQYGQQQVDAAERTLSEVSTRYPGTDAARTAEDRLRAIQLSQVQ